MSQQSNDNCYVTQLRIQIVLLKTGYEWEDTGGSRMDLRMVTTHKHAGYYGVSRSSTGQERDFRLGVIAIQSIKERRIISINNGCCRMNAEGNNSLDQLENSVRKQVHNVFQWKCHKP